MLSEPGAEDMENRREGDDFLLHYPKMFVAVNSGGRFRCGVQTRVLGPRTLYYCQRDDSVQPRGS